MITRLHARAGVYVSAILLLVGVALTAHATQPVTSSQMHEYVLATIGAAGVVVFGAFWILLVSISGRAERALMASVTRLEGAVSAFSAALAQHDASEFAHRAASEHNHGPMLVRIEEMDRKIDAILRDCDMRSCGPRDPMRSQNVRRASDPEGFDGRPERGRG